MFVSDFSNQFVLYYVKHLERPHKGHLRQLSCSVNLFLGNRLA